MDDAAGSPGGGAETSRVRSLTPRERQVLELVVRGLRSKEIAAELGISVKTVEVHRSRLMRKMKAGNLAQLGWQFAQTDDSISGGSAVEGSDPSSSAPPK